MNISKQRSPKNVKLKVCGITSLSDAHMAVDCGAEYLGFNFYTKSPRYIPPLVARSIIQSLPCEVLPVGIFVNEISTDTVTQTMRDSGVLLAQLSGDEDIEYCREIGNHRVIKAFRVMSGFDPESILKFNTYAILLDAYDGHSYGGTGKITNWDIARQASELTKIFLAGGLSPENITQAVITARPFAVDVNSGVEISPGVKDSIKLMKLASCLKAI